jgi:hypothetical protein
MLNWTVSGAGPAIVAPEAPGWVVKTACGGWFAAGVGEGVGWGPATVTSVEHRADCVGVVTVNAGVKLPGLR